MIESPPLIVLNRGEQTATALEASLSSLESKLDDILASFGVLPDEEEAVNEEALASGTANPRQHDDAAKGEGRS